MFKLQTDLNQASKRYCDAEPIPLCLDVISYFPFCIPPHFPYVCTSLCQTFPWSPFSPSNSHCLHSPCKSAHCFLSTVHFSRPVLLHLPSSPLSSSPFSSSSLTFLSCVPCHLSVLSSLLLSLHLFFLVTIMLFFSISTGPVSSFLSL